MLLNQIYPQIFRVITNCYGDSILRDLIERKLLIRALVLLSKKQNKEILMQTEHYLIRVDQDEIDIKRTESSHMRINTIPTLSRDREIWSYDIETYTDTNNRVEFLCGSIIKSRVEYNIQYDYDVLYFTDLNSFIGEFAKSVTKKVLCYGWNSSSFDIKFILRGLLSRTKGMKFTIIGYDRMPFVMIGSMMFLDAYLWYKKSLSEIGNKLPFPYAMYRNAEFKHSTIKNIPFLYHAKPEDFKNIEEYRKFVEMYTEHSDLCKVNRDYNIRDSVLCLRMVNEMYKNYCITIPLTITRDSIATIISLCTDELILKDGPKLSLTQTLLDSIANHPQNKAFQSKLDLSYVIISKKSYAMNAFKRYLHTVKTEIRKRNVFITYADRDYQIDLSNIGDIMIPLADRDERDHVYVNYANDAKLIYVDSLPELTDYVQLKFRVKLFSDLINSCNSCNSSSVTNVTNVIKDNLIEAFKQTDGEKIIHVSELLKEGALDEEITKFDEELYVYKCKKKKTLCYIYHQLRDKQKKRLEMIYNKVYMIKDNYAVVGLGNERFTYHNNKKIIGDNEDHIVNRIVNNEIIPCKLSDCMRDSINGNNVQIIKESHFAIGIDDKRIYDSAVINI